MKQLAYRPSGSLAATILCAAMTLGGCHKLVPNGQSNTITLLQSGSEKVCTASDVQQSLRDLVIPKATDVAGDAPLPDKESAIASLSLSHDLTTLQGFDKAVNKASCNTTVKITGAGGASNSFSLDYQISPSAEDPNAFVLTSSAADAKAYAKDLIDTALTQAAATHAGEQQKAQADQARAQLLAMLTPSWLVGTWIPTEDDAANCANGHSTTFSRNHVYKNPTSTGRWVLDADQLHLVGSGPSGGVDLKFTISQADAISYTITMDGANVTVRRCARDEIDAQSTSPTPALAAPELPAPAAQ